LPAWRCPNSLLFPFLLNPGTCHVSSLPANYNAELNSGCREIKMSESTYKVVENGGTSEKFASRFSSGVSVRKQSFRCVL
jgi:hypothetical protein